MQRFNGFIKIHRKLVSWGWYQDHVVKDLFLHLILTANFREQQWMGKTIGKGQVVTSTAHLASDLGFSVQQIRTAMNKLKATGEITSKATNKYTIITIVNWEKYQCYDGEEETDNATGNQTNQQQSNNNQITNHQQTDNNQTTSKQQTGNNQATNHQQQLKKDKNDKKDKKDKNKEIERKHKYGEYKNVLLSDTEMKKLQAEYPDWQQRIERLSGYMASTGRSYKNHLATIRNWARKDAEKGEGNGKSNDGSGQAGNPAEKSGAAYRGVQLSGVQL